MDNPELVEEYPREYELTQFEKIQVAAKRAKDLHNANKTPLVEVILMMVGNLNNSILGVGIDKLLKEKIGIGLGIVTGFHWTLIWVDSGRFLNSRTSNVK